MSYFDASMDFGPGGVLFLPEKWTAFWFSVWVPAGEPINVLEVVAVAVAGAILGLLIRQFRYAEELAFVDNNVSLAWVTRGSAKADRHDANALLEGMWLQLALRQVFKRWERMPSASNVADRPSRGLAPEVPCTCDLWELQGVRRWSPFSDGLGPRHTLPS